jgi:hypothetical protein
LSQAGECTWFKDINAYNAISAAALMISGGVNEVYIDFIGRGTL